MSLIFMLYIIYTYTKNHLNFHLMKFENISPEFQTFSVKIKIALLFNW